MKFKDFSRTSPKIQGRFKTMQTLREGLIQSLKSTNVCTIFMLLLREGEEEGGSNSKSQTYKCMHNICGRTKEN